MKTKKLKIGELVFLKNVGYPFNRTDDGRESWEGASGVVTGLNVGPMKMVEVTPLSPIKADFGHRMINCVFHPESVCRENRPWLRKHLKDILKLKKELIRVASIAVDMDME